MIGDSGGTITTLPTQSPDTHTQAAHAAEKRRDTRYDDSSSAGVRDRADATTSGTPSVCGVGPVLNVPAPR